MERKRVFARERETEREIVQVCVGFEVNFCLLNLETFFDCESDSLRERERERERDGNCVIMRLRSFVHKDQGAVSNLC